MRHEHVTIVFMLIETVSSALFGVGSIFDAPAAILQQEINQYHQNTMQITVEDLMYVQIPALCRPNTFCGDD